MVRKRLEAVPDPPAEKSPRKRTGALVTRNGTKVTSKSETVDVAVSKRLAMLVSGDIDIEDLDDEELARGQLKADDGTFRGRPGNWVPRAFYDKMVRELLRRGEGKYRENYIECLTAVTNIAKYAEKDADRLKAAIYVIERVAGPMPTKVEIKAEIKPWEQDVLDIIVDVPDPKELEAG